MGGSKAELQIVLRIIDEATKEIEKIGEKFKTAGGLISQDAVDASKKYAAGLAIAGTAVAGLGYMALNAAADLEQTQVAFTTMLGSAEKAQSFIQELIQFAKTTPFTLVGLEDAARRLLAFGIAQKDVLPDLKILGDIAAGVGMDRLPNLILAFGQVSAKTRLMGDDLRQFTEAGVPLLDELSKVTGYSVQQMAGNVGNMKISFNDVRNALAHLTAEGGRFHDNMLNQSKTFKGIVSNIQDAWNIFLTREGAQLLVWAKQLALIIMDLVQNKLPLWIDKINELTEFLRNHQIAIYVVVGAILGGLIPAVYAAAIAFGSAAIALAPFFITGAVIGGVIYGIVMLVKHWDLVKDKLDELAQQYRIFGIVLAPFYASGMAVIGLVNGAIAIANHLGQVRDAVSYVTSHYRALQVALGPFYVTGAAIVALADGMKLLVQNFDKVKAAIQFVVDKLKVLEDAYNRVAAMAKTPINFVTNMVSNAVSTAGSAVFSSIPKFAAGGIVTGPTLALIGEAGPEAVVPLSGGAYSGGGISSFGRGGATVTNNFYLQGNYLNQGGAREIAREFAQQIGGQLKLTNF
ncbi:tape measure protein [Rhodopseudomonas palustris]|uniref:tape measure protein n=1 Tax=Rhodopseudomonas palustris TaxID=1076 RepID=UPI000D1B7EA9|nr:tape measure protein [Rhodopseudomonas palustris]AVT83663.1 hypothetical protein RPYSC3_48030 [Rhodopseudomonas palustris]